MAPVKVTGTTSLQYYFPQLEYIPHYYGDIVRQIYLAIVVFMLAGAPFYSSDLGVEFPFIALGAIVIVGLGGITNPLKRAVMAANAAVSGSGVIIYEALALAAYKSGMPAGFVLRQIIAVLFLFAFYFSMKTFRAMLMDKIGKQPSPHDFDGDGNPDVNLLRNKKAASIERPEQPRDGLGHPAAPETDKLD